MKRDACFRLLASLLPDDIVVSTYSSAFEWLAIRPHPLNYVAVGAMGLASSHALGLALAMPQRRIVVLDGDGSLLMNLGTLVTIAAAAPNNLIHFVSRNGSYEANGGHPIPAQGVLDFAAIARSAGYHRAESFSELSVFSDNLAALLSQPGPTFVELHLELGDTTPAPDYEHIHGVRARREFSEALASGQGSLATMESHR
ncbi:MAG TPA: thiamine pyrophosphate-dependent enzyme [Ramlibacter sp.]|nr:thiamine pyrophosphate-dependent enzyme [Ramlibacter sp.]